ncbi:MAG: alpha/beta hydrolase [Solirubrobacteraceae bacterium]
MELQPRLIEVALPDRPAGAVLVLHGGARRGQRMMVSPTQLSVLRMIPVARRVARLGGRELAVFRLLNSYRGWDTRHTPVDDARWALQEIATRLGDRVPTCLIGHSLGGRAALFAAGRPEVRSVVALAPWVYPSDAPTGSSDRQILIVHGTRDRIASPQRSLALARRLQATATVRYVAVDGGRHAMLKHHRRFDSLAAEFAASTLGSGSGQ